MYFAEPPYVPPTIAEVVLEHDAAVEARKRELEFIDQVINSIINHEIALSNGITPGDDENVDVGPYLPKGDGNPLRTLAPMHKEIKQYD